MFWKRKKRPLPAPPIEYRRPGEFDRDWDSLQILVATHNTGKLEEFAALLLPLECEVFCINRMELQKMGYYDCVDPVEDGETFFQNAYIKARYWADLMGMPSLADDSGLMVRALDGEPGVRTGRWGEAEDMHFGTGFEQCRYLLGKMEGFSDRSAVFETSLVLAKPYTRDCLHYRGTIAGEITPEIRGKRGFGFDSVFLVPELGLTMGEISRYRKGLVSHRGKAFRAMRGDWDRVKEFLGEYMPAFPRPKDRFHRPGPPEGQPGKPEGEK